jgi:hypothetical protein
MSKYLSNQMLFGQLSFWANVSLGKCLSGQLSFWENILMGKCLQGKCLSGQMSFWANVLMGKCLLGKCLSGQMSFWANVICANVLLGKRRNSKRHGTVSDIRGYAAKQLHRTVWHINPSCVDQIGSIFSTL